VRVCVCVYVCVCVCVCARCLKKLRMVRMRIYALTEDACFLRFKSAQGHVHRVSKNNTPNSCSYLRTYIEAIVTLSRKFAIKGVATLPSEILAYKNLIDRQHSNGRLGVCIMKRMNRGR